MEDNKDKISWMKVLLAIAALIGLSFAYLQIRGIGFNNGILELTENVIPDLVAVLIIIPIIYFLFTLKGFSPEKDLANLIVNKLKGNHLSIQEGEFSKEELREDIRQSDETILIGLYLSTTINENHSFFEEELKKGKQLTFILLDPSDESTIEKSSRKFSQKVRFTPHQVKEEINLRISQLQNIRQSVSEGLQGNMKIMTIDYPLTFGGYLARRKNLGAKILVKLYGYQTKDINFMRIKLTPKNGLVFNEYAEQFENLVNDAREIKNENTA